MKKILSILPLLIFSLVSKSQYPVTQNLGSSSTLVQVPANGGFIANLINRTFVDTNAANSTNIKYYTGAQVYCSSDSSLYWRYNGAWIKMAGASGGATGSFWNLTGNYMNTIPSGFGIGTNSADNLPLRTNATTRAYIPAAGFVRSNDTTSNKIFTLNPSTGEWGYANWNNGGGGSTPTWQQTLTAGSTLTTDNTIDGGGNDFTFANNSSLFLRSLNTQNFGSLYLTDGQAELVGQVTGARISRILALGDSLLFEPYQGDINIDTIRAASDQNKLIGWTSTTGATRGEVGAVTIGSGLSLSAGTLSASGSSGWSLSGNSISTGIGDFFGSTNNRTVIVKTNNTKIAAWDSTGSLEIGSYGHQSILGSNDAKLIVQGTFGQFESGVLKAYIGQVSANTKLVLRNSSASDAVTLNTSGDSWLNGGNVGINQTSPNSTLHITGSLTKSITHVDADVTLNSTHYTIIIDAGSGGIIITLPAASSCTGREYVIVNLDIDATIDTYTDIKGSGSTIVKTNTALKIQSDGTGWYQTNN